MYKVVVRVSTHVCIADSTSEPLSYSSTAHTRQDYYNRLPLFVNHEQYVALNCLPPNDKCNSNENNNSNPDTTKSHCGVVYFQCRLNKLKCPNTVCSPGIRWFYQFLTDFQHILLDCNACTGLLLIEGTEYFTVIIYIYRECIISTR